MINTYPLQHLRCLAYIEATILNKMDGKLIPQFKDGKMAGGGGGGNRDLLFHFILSKTVIYLH